MAERRRFLNRPPERLRRTDPELYRYLLELQERISDMFGEAESKIPVSKFVEVTAKSLGSFREIIVPHSLGTNPTGFSVIDPPRGDYKFRKSRTTIGSNETAYFESDAPKGTAYLVRLEAR